MGMLEENIFGVRLQLARKMAGMSLQRLSDDLDNRVTKQALNKYELGLMQPTSGVLLALSGSLGVKPDYFLKKELVELGKISFRKKTSLLKKDEESIIEKARDYVERYLEIENLLGIQNEFMNPLESLKIASRKDVEMAALLLRKSWELGSNPIPNIIEMLELKGIKVYLIEDVDKLDGFAVFTSKGVPIVVVNSKDKPIERIRFTIIHELAHILLDFQDSVKDDDKMMERLCHYFSSCFIIPTDMLIDMVGGLTRSYIAIRELITIKEYYGISLRAIVHRLKEIKVITEVYYRKWMVWLTKEYGAKNEPGKYRGEERALRFEQLINRAISEEVISLSKAAAIANTDIGSIRKGSIGVN